MIRTGTRDDAAARAGLAARAAARPAEPQAKSRLRGKLNLFQAIVLRWRELHPYVAVHMVGVAHPLEAARLRETIGARLDAAGLARIALDPEAKRFEFRPGP